MGEIGLPDENSSKRAALQSLYMWKVSGLRPFTLSPQIFIIFSDVIVAMVKNTRPSAPSHRANSNQAICRIALSQHQNSNVCKQ